MQRRRTAGWVALVLTSGVLSSGTVAAAQTCDSTRVHTLVAQLPQAPSTFRAGRVLQVPLGVGRAAGVAPDVTLQVGLFGDGWNVYANAVTDLDGRAVARFAVPAGVRGAVKLDVDAYRILASLPCLDIEEYDRVVRPWGRVVA